MVHVTFQHGTCLINGICFMEGEQNSAHEVCEPTKSTTEWAKVPVVSGMLNQRYSHL